MRDNPQLSQAVRHHRAGRLTQAEAGYNQLLLKDPRDANALNLLGVLARQRGQFDKAIGHIQQAIAILPRVGDFHFNLGEALRASGRLEEAVCAYRKAIECQGDDAEIHQALAEAYRRLGLLEEAAAALERAVRLNPHSPEARLGLGNVLTGLNRAEAALPQYAQAIELKLDLAEAHLAMTSALDRMGRRADALAACRTAIRIKPELADAHNLLGTMLDRMGRLTEAAEAFGQALARQPAHAHAHSNLGNLLKDQGLIDRAIQTHRHAIELAPDLSRVHSNHLLCLNYHPTLDEMLIFQEHVRWGARFCREASPDFDRPNGDHRRLRVGFVSPDFKEHSVSYFLDAILGGVDEGRFEAICYSDVSRPDAVTERLRGLAHRWRETSHLSDEQLLAGIREDRVDVLVDLAGHTANNRLAVFAQHAAPVQVSYLGYPNTTGLPRSCMRYRLTDAYADPPGMTDQRHTEELVRLPGCFLCYRPHEQSPAVASPPFEKAGHITFGSFNALAKVTSSWIETVGAMMKAAPRSRLLLKCRSLGDVGTRQLVRERFASLDIAPDRLMLAGADARVPAHLARYGEVDIALDTFPYNGTTTTCEALWMGVPVVTLAGTSHRSRVGVSILRNLGLGDLIAENPERYVAVAVEMAGDAQRLRQLRVELRERMRVSPIMERDDFRESLWGAIGSGRRW